ncbi:MAG: hemerythrin domain-containing protein [bacterium]
MAACREGSTAPEAHDETSLDTLTLGIPAIDEEHLQILRLIKKIRGADPAIDHRVIQDVLLELRDYDAKHFHHKEQVILSAGFLGAESLIRMHRDLATHMDQTLADGANLHCSNLTELLEDWIRGHIMEEDRKYA